MERERRGSVTERDEDRMREREIDGSEREREKNRCAKIVCLQ